MKDVVQITHDDLMQSKIAEYELYFDSCERANRIPLTFDAWLAERNG